MNDDNNYFDHDEEDVLHDAFLMMQSEKTTYETIEDVLLNETVYDEDTIKFWSEHVDEFGDE